MNSSFYESLVTLDCIYKVSKWAFKCLYGPSSIFLFLLGKGSKKKNKNYYVVGDAGFARPRNTLKIISNFFLINQLINESMN